ncbi:MAG: ATP phosphoribosyltransferase regulatory subunit, partial [Butyricicoccus sp.]
RKVLNGFFAILGLTEKAGDVMRTIDKLEKIGAEKVKTILVEDFGVEAATADELLKFIETPGGTEGILAALDGYKGKNEVFDLGAEELKTVATYMQAFGVPADHFEIDLTIARGLDYYTGTVYGPLCSTIRKSVPSARAAATTTLPILHRQAAAGRWHLHRSDPSVLRSR